MRSKCHSVDPNNNFVDSELYIELDRLKFVVGDIIFLKPDQFNHSKTPFIIENIYGKKRANISFVNQQHFKRIARVFFFRR